MSTDNTILGQRIRDLRLRRGMTQKQLAGDAITRNMLSLIESGTATPSLSTLTELAMRLEVPAGYFFAADDDEMAYFLKMKSMPHARLLYQNGDYASCLALCTSLPRPDDEVLSLIAACHLAEAGDALHSCALATATHRLEKAASAAASSSYAAKPIGDTVAYLRLLMESVGSHEIPDTLCSSSAFPHMRIPAEFVAYVAAHRTLLLGDADAADALCRSGLIVHETYLSFLHAKIRIARGDTESASPILRRLLAAPTVGFFTQFHLLGALENCASAAGDFRSAYQFSTQKVELLELFTR